MPHTAEQDKAHRQKPEVRARLLAAQRLRYATDSVYRARVNDANRARYRDIPEHRERIRAASRAGWPMQNAKRRLDGVGCMLRSAQARAREHGLAFDITRADIAVPAHCPLLGIPLERHSGPGAPSLDRKVPSLGYVKGNVWVISHRANTMKSDASWQEIAALAEKLREATS